MGYFENIHFEDKRPVYCFWATFGKFGLLVILASGHTVDNSIDVGIPQSIDRAM